jgi:hypothetical protein
MQYKGDDLDLRVPHARMPREPYPADYDQPAMNGRWTRTPVYPTAAPEPLWVDEVLLACGNYAFDVAQANGAAEVDLEHLVNALTRVDAAARVLEARNVREGQLRRESAALIASELPAANAGDALSPRRSGDFEDVLRKASDIAHRRGAAAGVEDVLWVLLQYPRDLPVVLLLRRLTPDWQRADWGRLRDFAPVEPPHRGRDLQPVDVVPSRILGIEDSIRIMQQEFSAERKLLMDLVRDIQRDVVAQRGDGAAFRSDLGQRLEGLERMVHNRAEPARMQQIEKSLQLSLAELTRGSRDLAQRLASLETSLSDARERPLDSTVADRMTTLEKAVHSGLGEGARNWAHLGQRLATLEQALTSPREETANAMVAERLVTLEKTIQSSLADSARSLTAIAQRLSGFEARLAENEPARIAETVELRLAGIEHRFETMLASPSGASPDFADKLAGLGRLVEATGSQHERLRTDLAERLSSIETYLASPGTEDSASIREFVDRVGGLERAVRSGFGEAASSVAQIADRLQTVERRLGEQSGNDGEALLLLDERLASIERVVDTRGNQTLSATAQIAERLHILESRPLQSTDIDVSPLMSPLDDRLRGLEAMTTTKVETMQATLADIVVKLGQLDERIRAEAVVTEEALRGRDQDFDFIYGEIKQLGQSQTTLNSAVNDWRTESQTNFGTVTSRLDKLQTLTLQEPAALAHKPIEVATTTGMATSTGGVDGSHPSGAATTKVSDASSVKADDYALAPRQDGFWYWLFGTDSVLRANRETDLKAGRMQQNIKEARERKRMQA